MTGRIVAAALLWGLLTAAAPPLTFVPVGLRFAPAADEYRALWEQEGPRIVAAMEAATGLPFPSAPIEAIVGNGPPMTAYDGRTIRLRAAYSPAYKKATLVHEIGHRLAMEVRDTAGLDDHRLLYLFLYDVWTDLYGPDFADTMVRIERRIPGPGDYDAAWKWALAMSRQERRARLQQLAMRAFPRLHQTVHEQPGPANAVRLEIDPAVADAFGPSR
ncbi:hypothetical protein [Sphingosinicella sp. CPCC 101087]|uniref:hypothetical protein n=1 Tax=Sphingosinicella sp. CPCC 101087 TaxID=2497754 RepID=UPI00101DFB93|nr:hypothetical protein [Sphingosinicella sp. CPCC 101087]